MIVNEIKGKLIISCQSVDDEPLNDANVIAKMAKACVIGGAEILRMSQIEHIKKAMEIIDIPIIGLVKKHYNDSEVFITPTMIEVDELANLGVSVIAIDATNRERPNGIILKDLINKAKQKYPEILFMADCSTLNELRFAEKLPFDILSSTLCGYTKDSANITNIKNNYKFVKKALKITSKPFIVEGGIWEPKQAKDLFKIGAYAVVVGSAITRPHLIVNRWLKKVF